MGVKTVVGCNVGSDDCGGLYQRMRTETAVSEGLYNTGVGV